MQISAKKGKFPQYLATQEELMAWLPRLLEENDQLHQEKREHLLCKVQIEQCLQAAKTNARLF